ncbi:MAG: hypothetical protein QOE77_2027 [Blastocatellia bacterium]|jgi:hypothetical protein|nr:hypothetical protein [Blastocatellia bacterium]
MSAIQNLMDANRRAGQERASGNSSGVDEVTSIAGEPAESAPLQNLKGISQPDISPVIPDTSSPSPFNG